MKMLRMAVPVVVALFALTGAATSAFAAGHPADATLTPAAGPTQESDEATAVDAVDNESDEDGDVRPDHERPKHRAAALCARAHDASLDSDVARDISSILQRCRDFLSDQVDRHPGQVCRKALESDSNRDIASIIARCRDHLGERTDLSRVEICRRAANGELDGDRIAEILERCRDHFGDGDHRPIDLCLRAHDALTDGDANRDLASIIERCRDHFGDQTDRPNPRLRLQDGVAALEQARARLAELAETNPAAAGQLRERLANAETRLTDARDRLLQLDRGDLSELLRNRDHRTDRAPRVPADRVPGQVLPTQVQ